VEHGLVGFVPRLCDQRTQAPQIIACQKDRREVVKAGRNAPDDAAWQTGPSSTL
jgi:hypothetical protein